MDCWMRIGTTRRPPAPIIASTNVSAAPWRSSGPGQRHTLALPARQGDAALADHGVHAGREGVDELVGLGGGEGPPHLVVGGAGAEVDVASDRLGEEERLLEHQAAGAGLDGDGAA